MSKIIGSNIRNIRKSNGYNQEALAQKLNMSRQRLARIENGLIDVSFEELSIIASALNSNVESLTDQSLSTCYRNEESQDKNIDEMINFFFANKHLYEKTVRDNDK